ncbi:hypothetical protein KKG72_11365 [bacterium]|nr:hypothetical protein [bacterium]MBU1994682.1 hypothetical protein [bacterium]
MKSFIVVFLLVGMWNSLYAQHLIEYDYELDAYYTNVSAFIDLDTEHEVTDASSYSEAKIYTDLVLNSLSPNILLIEAAVHPMPIAGLYFRQNHEEQYDKAKLQNFNLVKAVTAGFEEPYSLSVFVGRMMIFKNNESDRIGKNRAYMGYLVSVGDYSIKDNMAHIDRWMNFEFKLKGTKESQEKDLDWSFRIGSRIHENKDFTNSFYIGARRSSIDYKKGVWSFIYNSAFSSMFAVSADTFDLTEAEIIVEKKWPLSWSEKVSFGLGLGYLYNSGAKYSGALKEEGIDNHQLIFRPNFKW